MEIKKVKKKGIEEGKKAGNLIIAYDWLPHLSEGSIKRSTPGRSILTWTRMMQFWELLFRLYLKLYGDDKGPLMYLRPLAHAMVMGGGMGEGRGKLKYEGVGMSNGRMRGRAVMGGMGRDSMKGRKWKGR